MATAGLYETSGDWLYDIGLPGKSGIGGGIVTVSPGKGGLGTFAPRLDQAGNSVKGQLVAHFLSERLGMTCSCRNPRLERPDALSVRDCRIDPGQTNSPSLGCNSSGFIRNNGIGRVLNKIRLSDVAEASQSTAFLTTATVSWVHCSERVVLSAIGSA